METFERQLGSTGLVIGWRISNDAQLSDSGSLVNGDTAYQDMEYRMGRTYR